MYKSAMKQNIVDMTSAQRQEAVIVSGFGFGLISTIMQSTTYLAASYGPATLYANDGCSGTNFFFISCK